jgi:hypothetical protein
MPSYFRIGVPDRWCESSYQIAPTLQVKVTHYINVGILLAKEATVNFRLQDRKVELGVFKIWGNLQSCYDHASTTMANIVIWTKRSSEI